MTQQEIFDKIVETAAKVSGVSVAGVMGGCRSEGCCAARSISIFWCVAAKMTTDDLLRCTGRTNHNSIDSIKLKTELDWVQNWYYHMLIVETGKKLLEFAHTIGEDFDPWKPIVRMQEITGKCYYHSSPF